MGGGGCLQYMYSSIHFYKIIVFYRYSVQPSMAFISHDTDIYIVQIQIAEQMVHGELDLAGT